MELERLCRFRQKAFDALQVQLQRCPCFAGFCAVVTAALVATVQRRHTLAEYQPLDGLRSVARERTREALMRAGQASAAALKLLAKAA
jgi:heme exporter protein D